MPCTSNQEQRKDAERTNYSLWSSEEVEQIIVMERLDLYNHGLPCGAVVLHRHLRECLRPQPPPSVRKIARVLTRYGLTYGRTGWYEGGDPDDIPPSARIPMKERR